MISADATRSPSSPLTREHLVLCVDDEPRTLSALQRTLRREPYEVVVTGSPWEALSWVDARDVSLVISDQRMPEMCGSEMIAEIRARSPGTLCVLLTAYPGSVSTGGADWRDVGELILKPWDDHQLRRIVRSLLRDRESGGIDDLDAPELGGEAGGS